MVIINAEDGNKDIDGGRLPTGEKMLGIYVGNFYHDKLYAKRAIEQYIKRRIAEAARMLRDAAESDNVYEPTKYVAAFCIGATGRRYLQISLDALRGNGLKVYPVQVIEGEYDEGKKKRPIRLRDRDLRELRVIRPAMGIFVDKNTRSGATLLAAANEIAGKADYMDLKRLFAYVMLDGAGATTVHVDHYKSARSDIGCKGEMVGLRRFMERFAGTQGHENLSSEMVERLFHDGKYLGSELDFDPTWLNPESDFGVVPRAPARIYPIEPQKEEKVA